MHPSQSIMGVSRLHVITSFLFLVFSLPLAREVQAQSAASSSTDPAAEIVNYLLGKTHDAAGLDVNGDAMVTVTDVVYAIAHRVPMVSSFAIAAGASSTSARKVTLNNACTNSPACYMASESSTFSGAVWQTYVTSPSFMLSTGNLSKTVYFKVKTASGVESPVVSDTITLDEIIPLTVGAAAVTGSISPAGDTDWFQLKVSASSTYVIETWPGTLTSNVMRLYGPGNRTTYITVDRNSSANKTAKIAMMLVPGTYYAKVLAYEAGGAGSYTIKVSDIGALKVTSLAVGNGAVTTTQRTITLNNACAGAPTQYLASESADFSGATWKTYVTAPSFSLSAGNLTKRVYFKVKDVGGTESPVVSDTIALAKTVTLSMGAAAVIGNISPAGDADWWSFTISATSTYSIESWPGTLADNTMGLYVPDSMTQLMASDDNSGSEDAAKIALTLKAGKYYAKVQAADANAIGDYTIQVSNLGALKVNSFSINSGASLATNRTVTLNNACTGAPTHYMASESSSFNGASWKAYATAPSFTLSSGNASKKVYFKVKDLSGTESAVVGDSITLKEMTALPTDGTIVSGNIAKANEEDWYLLTIKTSGLYTIQTYTGSLSDTAMGLADKPDPDDDEWIIENDNIDDDSDLMSQVTVWLTAGTYYARVMSADASTGSYTIRAWQPTSKRLSVNGSTVTGNISSSSDVDWYQFTISSGGVYSIETEADGLEDGSMMLYSSSFHTVASNEDGTGADEGSMPAITASLSAGTYLVRFVGASSEDTGTYTIKARSGSISGGTISLMINGPITGGVISEMDSSGNTDTDTYQFIVTDDDKYTITMTAGSLGMAYLGLTDSDQGTITEASSQTSGEMPGLSEISLEPGVYYLIVQGYYTTDAGSYKIKVKN